MPTISDYVVLADGQTALKIGGDIDQTFNFTVPSNVNRNQQAVLTLQMEAENPSALKWKMDINGTDVMSFTHGQDRFCAIQEVFGGIHLNSGANTATVRVISGGGTLKVSDIVVHFQANI